MSINLGPNPVDLSLAFRAAVESSLDIISSQGEITENCMDNESHNITININGKRCPTNPDNILVDSICTTDDGSGMDIGVMLERFRGAFFDSESHDRSDKSGRNGVGIKTNLQYWGEIHVSTTTKGKIPGKDSLQCSKENKDFVYGVYKKASVKKEGNSDTERRTMVVRVDSSELLPFDACLRDDSGTSVTLMHPRQTIELNIKDFIRKQGYFIDWLSNPANTLIVKYPSERGRPASAIIQPFYMINKPEFMCHVKGVNTDTMDIIYNDSTKTKISDSIPPNKNPLVSDMEVDIRVTDINSQNDFIISVCGANVFRSSKRTTKVPPAIEYLMSQGHYKSPEGFANRIHGYIKTNDERIKRALRHNKSVLDEEDKYARAFISYISTSIIKPLNDIYSHNITISSDREDTELLKEVQDEFNKVVKRVVAIREKDIKSNPEKASSLNREYCCNSCGILWKAPIEKKPSYCAEFNITGEKGCGSRDISKNTRPRGTSSNIKDVKFQWVTNIGGFLPAAYNDSNNTMDLNANHPSLMTPLKGYRGRLQRTTACLDNAFFAKAIFEAKKGDKNISDTFGECLKQWYENRSNRDKLKIECRRKWKESNLTIDQI